SSPSRHLLPFCDSYTRRGARHSHIIRLRNLRIVCEKFLLIEPLGLARRGHCDTDVPAIPRGRLTPGELLNLVEKRLLPVENRLGNVLLLLPHVAELRQKHLNLRGDVHAPPVEESIGHLT